MTDVEAGLKPCLVGPLVRVHAELEAAENVAFLVEADNDFVRLVERSVRVAQLLKLVIVRVKQPILHVCIFLLNFADLQRWAHARQLQLGLGCDEMEERREGDRCSGFHYYCLD